MAETQYVTLNVDAESFAVPVTQVREILDYVEPFRLPEGADYLIGVIDVRGQAVPLADLRLRLGRPRRAPDAATRILVLDLPMNGGMLTIALVADRVRDVVSVAQDAVQPPQPNGPSIPGYITGIARLAGGFVAILDAAKLLSDAPLPAGDRAA